MKKKCMDCKKKLAAFTCVKCDSAFCPKCLEANDNHCPYCSDTEKRAEKPAKKKASKKKKKEDKFDMQLVKSSNVAEVGYNVGTLRVKFKNGSEYEYKSVPEEYHQAMLQAESIGSFISKNIKGKFRFSKIN
ncbi:KTSC domain-containing protein [Candidatus Woesearchaeota archaeon]|nr:KTSC domain-containing protein [Candidatus Woesearchaeota archaeon]